MTRTAFLALALAACAIQNPPPAGQKVRVGDDGAEIELNPAAIRAYVVRGDYKSWLAEPAVHDRTQNSPHGAVRVFWNRVGADALRGAATTLPMGSMIVKELYQGDGATLAGYATMTKHEPDKWLWWEAFSGNLDSPAAFGVDHRTCVGCHGQGRDYVRSPLPQ
jgi:hypothetical protein